MSDTNDALGIKGVPKGSYSIRGFPKRALNRYVRKLTVLPREIIPGYAMTATMAEKIFKAAISVEYVVRK